jgi:hypothetical protein
MIEMMHNFFAEKLLCQFQVGQKVGINFPIHTGGLN